MLTTFNLAADLKGSQATPYTGSAASTPATMQIKGLNSAKRKRPPCYGRSGRLCYN